MHGNLATATKADSSDNVFGSNGQELDFTVQNVIINCRRSNARNVLVELTGTC